MERAVQEVKQSAPGSKGLVKIAHKMAENAIAQLGFEEQPALQVRPGLQGPDVDDGADGVLLHGRSSLGTTPGAVDDRSKQAVLRTFAPGTVQDSTLCVHPSGFVRCLPCCRHALLHIPRTQIQQAPQAGMLKVARANRTKDSWVLVKVGNDFHVGLIKHLVRVKVGDGVSPSWRRVLVYQWFKDKQVLSETLGAPAYRVYPGSANTTVQAVELTPLLHLRKLCHAHRTQADVELDIPRSNSNDVKCILLFITPHARFFH